MVQVPILTQAQCSGTAGAFTVRVAWVPIQGQTFFLANVFDPLNVSVASLLVDGTGGTAVAMLTAVPLVATTNYTVAVLQCDSNRNPLSPYSQPLNLLQAPLTNVTTVNDLTQLTIGATLPAVGAPTGISFTLLDSNNNQIFADDIPGSGGTIVLPAGLDPARTYSAYVKPSSNQGLSTGGSQRVALQMARPAISAIVYDGSNMTVTAAAAVPAGSTLSGTLFADGSPLLQQSGSTTSVTFPLALATLDMSKGYGSALRAVTGGNSGPASRLVPAVVAPPRLESAYYAGGHAGARWSVPPVAPAPTGALLTAIADGQTAGAPKTTLGYSGDIDISSVTVATSLRVQVSSVFGIAQGPPASVDLPFVKPSISSVEAGAQGIDVAWANSGSAPGYRLSLNDANGNPVASVDTTDLKGALAAPVNPNAVYSISVQPFGASAAGIEIKGPASTAAALLAVAPTVTTTSYDGARVTVNWAAPAQTAGITGFDAVLLDAATLRPTGATASVGAGVTSAQIVATLAPGARVVAAARATGAISKGPLGPAVEVIAFAPVVTATDVSAGSVHVAWAVPAVPEVAGYTVTISDDAGSPTTTSWDTFGTELNVPNTLAPAQVNVRVAAKGAASTGPAGPAANLFGAEPSFYPQAVSNSDPRPWLIRSAGNRPVPADIVLAFPDIFTTAPSTLPSAGVFALLANGGSALLPYKMTIAAGSVAWSFDAASRRILASDFLAFLKKLEMPDGSNVQIKPGALSMVRQSLALGLPLLFSEQLQFMYGFNADPQTGGYVDLVPGMRLRVDSEVQQLTPPVNNQMGYVPAGTSTYEIQSYVQGDTLGTGFDAFLSALGRPTVPSPLRGPNAGGGGIIDLYNPDGRKPYFRLLYPSAIRDPKYTGLVDESSLPVILGAATYNQMAAATDQYVTQGNLANLSGIFPFYFRGRATLSPEISVTLDGQRLWMGLGSTVANLIAARGALPACVSASVGGFAMRRSVGPLSSDVSASAVAADAVTTNRVRLEYPVATFAPTRPGYFGLPLFAGDEIRLYRRGPG